MFPSHSSKNYLNYPINLCKISVKKMDGSVFAYLEMRETKGGTGLEYHGYGAEMETRLPVSPLKFTVLQGAKLWRPGP